MATMAQPKTSVTVGVDTHGEVHVAAVLDEVGRLLGTIWVPSTAQGYERLRRYAQSFGEIQAVGVEGTGAYGAGLARHLHSRGIRVIEVDRPDRETRRAKGKSDPIDAEAAARSVLSGAARGTPKSRDGAVEMIRTLRVCRRSAMLGRIQAMNQLHSLVSTAPEELRAELRDCTPRELVLRGRWVPWTGLHPGLGHQARPSGAGPPAPVPHRADPPDRRRPQALGGPGRSPAGGHQRSGYPDRRPAVGERRGQPRAAAFGVGLRPPVRGRSRAGVLGQNHPTPPEPVRYRAANYALWRVVMVRLTSDERTKAYMARRRGEGLSKREVIRCLKRYVAREVYRSLVDER